MALYSIAKTKDNLSRLVDKALAGEEVIVTRHGKPTICFAAVETATRPERTRAEWSERLRAFRETLPRLDVPNLDLKREEDEADGAL